MDYDVIVIGGGIGGLTTAALLAARGVRVGVFERAPEVGGCMTAVEASGYRFDPGAGLYAGWGPGEIHSRVFEELGVTAPVTSRLETPFVVRLPDGVEFPVTSDRGAFAEQISKKFPECTDAALGFYRELEPIATALNGAIARVPALATATGWERAKMIAWEPRTSSRILATMSHRAGQHLSDTSVRFRRFIDLQLQLFGLCGSDDCAYLYAAMVLTLPHRGLYGIRGGGTALVAALADAITGHGGAVHCNRTVLRLVRDADGRAAGVDLINGERVMASTAVVSNLTAADSYGKLVGWDLTPPGVRGRIRDGSTWGSYQVFLSADAHAVEQLPGERVIALTDWQSNRPFAPDRSLFLLNAKSEDANAPPGRRALTVSTFCETAPWFEFQSDGDEHESRDQVELDRWWTLVCGAAPELAEGLEVIATATPRTVYDYTRRILGTVGGLGQSLAVFGPNALTHRTPVPGLYMVGDSVFPGNGVAAVTMSGLIVANEICG